MDYSLIEHTKLSKVADARHSNNSSTLRKNFGRSLFAVARRGKNKTPRAHGALAFFTSDQF